MDIWTLDIVLEVMDDKGGAQAAQPRQAQSSRLGQARNLWNAGRTGGALALGGGSAGASNGQGRC